MKHKICVITIGLGILAIGATYLGKKSGLLDSETELYDEYDTSNMK